MIQQPPSNWASIPPPEKAENKWAGSTASQSNRTSVRCLTLAHFERIRSGVVDRKHAIGTESKEEMTRMNIEWTMMRAGGEMAGRMRDGVPRDEYGGLEMGGR